MNKKLELKHEFIRKIIHLVSGLAIITIYTALLIFVSESIALFVITGLLLILLEIEYVRIEHSTKILHKLQVLLRPHEQDNITGSVFFLISCIICFAAFNYWIAVLAMSMMIFGDFFAAIIGKSFGKIKLHKQKTIIGTLGGLMANLLIGILILPEFFFVFIPMAIIASLVELLTNKLDDNLTVPLFAGFMGQMIVKYYNLNLPSLDFSILGFF